LITKDIIDLIPYNNECKKITWEQCTLRDYLNEEFYHSDSFSDVDRKRIVRTALANPPDYTNGTHGGAITQDYIFCLNIDEAEKYFKSDNDRKATHNGTGSSWWLRSPGFDPVIAVPVDTDGYVNLFGNYVHNTSGVRPALWLNL